MHAAGPVFLLDVGQGLEVAPVMGVAGPVTHILKVKVTGEIVMNEDTRDVSVDIAGSGADAQDGQERGAQQVEPTGTAFDADSGFVEVFDRDHGPDPVDDVLEALCGAPAHGGDRSRGNRHGEPVAHQVGQSRLGTDLDMQQIAHSRGDAWPVLDRDGHPRREDRVGHGGAGGRIVIHDMVRDRSRGQGRSPLARLIAARLRG